MSRYVSVAAGLLVLVLLAGSHWKAYVAGGNSVHAEWEKEKRELAESTLAQNRQILRAFENEAEKARKERERVKAETDQLLADLRDSDLRLHVATKSCEAGDSAAGDQQARAELVPEAAARILSVGIDGDAAVRELNECIDKYDAIRAQYE